ncbi:hypothetical protein L211DRAFT_842536 [Terfezia boudieri ATCC MYA-4762]|uniref:Uncharacterized protein n=1 Tax=Terfezia boudieri ATCC MYA-4762 TaxID=1051890 RepID=A0A3N4L981_9PEZI|nr:hypothetical protein L211DRAFT_842536 [Terfezia boudieri ATCC MYA-4762]
MAATALWPVTFLVFYLKLCLFFLLFCIISSRVFPYASLCSPPPLSSSIFLSSSDVSPLASIIM